MRGVKISNRLAYTLIAFAIVFAFSVVVYAYNSGGPASSMGHTADEIIEADPQVGTIENGKWCTGDSSGNINCEQDAPSGQEILSSVTFTDPEEIGSSNGNPVKDVKQNVWVNTGSNTIACAWNGNHCTLGTNSYPAASCGSLEDDHTGVVQIDAIQGDILLQDCGGLDSEECDGTPAYYFLKYTYCSGWEIE